MAMASVSASDRNAAQSLASGAWLDWRSISGTTTHNSDATLLRIQDNPCAVMPLVPGKLLVWLKGFGGTASDGYMALVQDGNQLKIRQRIENGNFFECTGLFEVDGTEWVQPKIEDNFQGSQMSFSCVFIAD